MDVTLASSSCRMLFWERIKCWMATKAMPVWDGRFLSTLDRACKPPADDPNATTVTSEGVSGFAITAMVEFARFQDCTKSAKKRDGLSGLSACAQTSVRRY